MLEILVINEVYFARHGKIFDGNNAEIPFHDVRFYRAVSNDCNAQPARNKLLYGGDAVHLHYHVERIYVFAAADKMIFKQRARIGFDGS